MANNADQNNDLYWKKLDDYLQNQMQKVNAVVQSAQDNVASLNATFEKAHTNIEESQENQPEEISHDFLDDAANTLLDKVNQEMETMVANINQQIGDIKEKSSL
jgi:uncharacterized phage infection (PIP) family protein YhgE